MKALHVLVFAALLAAGTSPALAVDINFPGDAPELDAIRDKIEAADYRGAIADLNVLIEDGVEHADVYNLMGFSLRKSGDTEAAMTFYQKALDSDPDHKGALEYSGELYLQLGDVARARQNEARLKALCPQGCEELSDLQQALSRASAPSQ